uniref:Cellulose synthase-like protein n=1 Tax=Tanacetum cinerariifolium TaxID=118510 RepID=A0A6L2KMH5_TANCI|nr:cellulose synthase-like protein [Tanacetum cinerariifolium]
MGRVTAMTSWLFSVLSLALKLFGLSKTVFEVTQKEQSSNDDDDDKGRFTFDKSPMIVSGVTILLVNLTALVNEKGSKSNLSMIKVQFDMFIHSDVLKPFDPYSSSASYDQKVKENFKDYTQMEAQPFKDLIIQHMESIKKCIIERVKASDASSRKTDYNRIVSDKGNDQVEVPYTAEYNVFAIDTQHSEQPECIINTCVVEKVDSNVIPDSPDMCDNEIRTDHNAVECDDECVALTNLIANLKHDVDENKKIQNKFKKANTSLTQELKECKSTLAETSRTLG